MDQLSLFSPTKHCPNCDQDLPLMAFGKDKNRRDGKYPLCRSCKNSAQIARRAQNPEQYRHTYRRWREANKTRKKELWDKWRIENATSWKEYQSIWYINNRDRILQESHNAYCQNPEFFREKARKIRSIDPELYNSRTRKSRREHPERFHIYDTQHHKRRRALKNGAAINDLTHAQWIQIQEHYGFRCVYCGKKAKKLTQDHITPLSKGGNHTLSNVVPSCARCNSKKGVRNVLIPIQPLLLI